MDYVCALNSLKTSKRKVLTKFLKKFSGISFEVKLVNIWTHTNVI